MAYKVIHDNNIIDVIKYPKFVKFLASGHVAMTDRQSADGVVGSDSETIYSLKQNKAGDLLTIRIEEIDDIEFSRLNGLLNSDQVISADESALAKAKKDKLRSLSSICKSKITAGFTIELSSDKHNFKLTTEDQLNLMQIENQLALGETHFVYHSTNQPCRIYTKDEMYIITKAFRKHVLYHTTYYNAAKQYVNSLVDIEKVNLFCYGTDVSEIISDPVLKQILKNGGNT